MKERATIAISVSLVIVFTMFALIPTLSEFRWPWMVEMWGAMRGLTPKDHLEAEVALEPFVSEDPARLESCNCTYCRGIAEPLEHYDDGEVEWFRCLFCRRHFVLEDMECLSGDEQACIPCVSGWRKRGCP